MCYNLAYFVARQRIPEKPQKSKNKTQKTKPQSKAIKYAFIAIFYNKTKECEMADNKPSKINVPRIKEKNVKLDLKDESEIKKGDDAVVLYVIGGILIAVMFIVLFLNGV